MGTILKIYLVDLYCQSKAVTQINTINLAKIIKGIQDNALKYELSEKIISEKITPQVEHRKKQIEYFLMTKEMKIDSK